MRLWVALLLLWIAASARSQSHSNPVLVLVEPALLDPNVDPDTYLHPTWVRWPSPGEGPSSRLLSIGSGVDWHGESADTSFRPAASTWTALNAASLARRGYLPRRRAFLADWTLMALRNPSGAARPDALLLGLSSGPDVRPLGLEETWPGRTIMVIEASAADDLTAAERSTSGRIAIVEWPPRAGQNWSRIYLRGHGWPDKLPSTTGIPGLIEARDIVPLLLRRPSVKWSSPPANWPGANRWMGWAQHDGPWFWSILGFATAALAIAACVRVGREQPSSGLAFGLRAVSLGIPAAVAGGNFSRLAGLQAWPVWLVAAWLGMLFVAEAARRLWPGSGTASHAFVGAAALLLLDPRFSLSGIELGIGPVAPSGLALGAALAAVCRVAAVPRGKKKLLLLVASAALAAAGWSLHPWWTEAAIWPFLAAVIGLGGFYPHFLAPAFLLSPGLGNALLHGFVFSPQGLVRTEEEIGGVPFDRHLAFLVCPSFLVGGFLFAIVLIFSNGFFAHEMRRNWRRSRSARSLVGLASVSLCGAVLWPPMLAAAFVTLLFGFIDLLETAVSPIL